MLSTPRNGRAFRRLVRCRGRRFRARRTRRGVSDVVATILLLALTVTLFSAIFAFVTSFPSPPAQNSNQFQASLILSSGGSCTSSSGCAIGLSITHLAGPQVPGNALIYLRSSVNPASPDGGCPWLSPVTVASGISSSVWSLGQVWSENFVNFPGSGSGCAGYTGDPLPDNITVYIVSASTLIFSTILPGQQILSPPTIVAAWISPSPAVPGNLFQVLATITGTLSAKNYPAVNLSAIPGYPASTAQKMYYSASTGQWQLSIVAANTTSVTVGTYYGFVNITGVYGTATAAVTVTISASGATLTVTPSSTTGSSSPVTATLTGAGFAASSHVSITYSGASGSITPASCTTGTFSGSTITTTAAGAFVCTYSAAVSTTTSVVYLFTAFDALSGQVATDELYDSA